jgi:hypothetical protein
MTMKFTYAPGAQPVQGYTIRRGVGRGGFGEIYQAVSDGGKEVALKLVQRHLDVELRGVGQCLNLKHPHLVVVFDILKAENDDAWIVMEYVAGESLDQVLARHPRGVPEQEALAWLRGACEGVGYLHDRGIVHRDLKPGNLFIEDGVVKVGDYGLSKFISASRRSGHTESVGTVHYMAPETSRGRYGKEVDQYALGVILYELLTGRPPFDGESVGEILMKHLTAEPDLGRLPEAYRAPAARLLSKDPQRRYPSMRDVLAALPEVGFVRPSAVRGPAAVPGTAQPDHAEGRPSDSTTHFHQAEDGRGDEAAGAESGRSGSGRRKGADFGNVDLIRLLLEHGIDTDEIKRLARTFAAEKALQGLMPAVKVLVENGVEAARDIERVVRVLGEQPGQEAAGKIRIVQVLVENGMDAGEDIARVLGAVAACPQPAFREMGTAVKVLVENGVGAAEDIERVLRVLARHPRQAAGMVRAVQILVENGVESGEDIARVLDALGEHPEQDLPLRVQAVKGMVENGMEAEDVARVLHVLGGRPEKDLPELVRVVQQMVENGMDSGDVERALG